MDKSEVYSILSENEKAIEDISERLKNSDPSTRDLVFFVKPELGENFHALKKQYLKSISDLIKESNKHFAKGLNHEVNE